MKKLIHTLAVIACMSLASCTTYHQTLREPNTRVELEKEDFTLSDQVSAEAKSTKVLGIDWARLFVKRTGQVEGSSFSISISSIPVIGNFVTDKTSSYALYELMQNNKGYDVIFYPQFETKIVRPILGIGFFAKITKVKATGRLGKLNK